MTTPDKSGSGPATQDFKLGPAPAKKSAHAATKPVASADSPARVQRVKLQVSPDAPTLGTWKLFVSWLYKFFNLEDKQSPGYFRTPKLTRKEQSQRQAAARAAIQAAQLAQRMNYKQDLIERLQYLARLGIAPIMCFLNIKSSGKTSAAIGVGSVTKWHTQKSTLLMPATMNTATATAGQMAGISGNAMTVKEYMESLKGFGSARTLEKRLPLTKWGLGVIIEDDNNTADEDDAFAVKKFMDMIDVTLPKVSILIFDQGQDNISRRSIALQAGRLGHVFNFVFMHDSAITQRTLKSTITGFWGDKGIPEDVFAELYEGFENKDESGYRTSTRDKVENSVAIATKANTGDDVDFEYFMRPLQDADSDRLPQWQGTGICIPTESSIGREDTEGRLIPFDLEALDLETYIAYLEIAVANFEIAGRQLNFEIGHPMVANLPLQKFNPRPTTDSARWQSNEGETS